MKRTRAGGRADRGPPQKGPNTSYLLVSVCANLCEHILNAKRAYMKNDGTATGGSPLGLALL